MKKIIALFVTVSLAAILTGCTPYHTQGSSTGAVIGGIAGALLDHRNPWRGGAIGAALGGAAGATIADASVQASREAVSSGRPVAYMTEDGRGLYRVDPVDYNNRTKCHKVQERVWENGQLIKDQTREICEGDKLERRY